MALWGTSSPQPLLIGLLSILILHPILGIRLGIVRHPSPDIPVFREAPAFRNGDQCGYKNSDDIHVAMTLDANYLRGTMAAVFSMLQHSTCPENLKFHFLSAHSAPELFSSIKSTFPYLNFKTYAFDSNRVHGKISRSIRQALDRSTGSWCGKSETWFTSSNTTFISETPISVVGPSCLVAESDTSSYSVSFLSWKSTSSAPATTVFCSTFPDSATTTLSDSACNSTSRLILSNTFSKLTPAGTSMPLISDSSIFFTSPTTAAPVCDKSTWTACTTESPSLVKSTPCSSTNLSSDRSATAALSYSEFTATKFESFGNSKSRPT